MQVSGVARDKIIVSSGSGGGQYSLPQAEHTFINHFQLARPQQFCFFKFWFFKMSKLNNENKIFAHFKTLSMSRLFNVRKTGNFLMSYIFEQLMFVVVLSIYFNLQPTELRVEILFNTKVTSCDVECFKMVCNYLTQRINI